jgi:hypothetical protein
LSKHRRPLLSLADSCWSLSGALSYGFEHHPGYLRSTASDPSLSSSDRPKRHVPLPRNGGKAVIQFAVKASILI